MNAIKWLVVIVLAGLLGVLFVQYLSVHPLQMSLYLFATCVVLFVLIVVLKTSFHRTSLLLAILLSLGVFIVGHLSMTKIILTRDDPRPVPELTRAPGDPGLGHTAVVYFTHGEPETYNPIGWINQFNEFDEQGIAFVPMIARPFFFNALRNGYLEIGKSNHRDIHYQMVASLEAAYRTEGDTTTKFYVSFLDDNPRPDAAAIQALNEGASKIVVSEVFTTISNFDLRIVSVQSKTCSSRVYCGFPWSCEHGCNGLWGTDLGQAMDRTKCQFGRSTGLYGRKHFVTQDHCEFTGKPIKPFPK